MSEKGLMFIGGRSGCNPVRNAIKALLASGEKTEMSPVLNSELKGSRSNAFITDFQLFDDMVDIHEMKTQLLNIQLLKSIPDHVLVMVNNMPESLQSSTLDIIKSMIEKGEIVIARHTNTPPIIQKLDEKRNISYHLPPLDIGVKI